MFSWFGKKPATATAATVTNPMKPSLKGSEVIEIMSKMAILEPINVSYYNITINGKKVEKLLRNDDKKLVYLPIGSTDAGIIIDPNDLFEFDSQSDYNGFIGEFAPDFVRPSNAGGNVTFFTQKTRKRGGKKRRTKRRKANKKRRSSNKSGNKSAKR